MQGFLDDSHPAVFVPGCEVHVDIGPLRHGSSDADIKEDFRIIRSTGRIRASIHWYILQGGSREARTNAFVGGEIRVYIAGVVTEGPNQRIAELKYANGLTGCVAGRKIIVLRHLGRGEGTGGSKAVGAPGH